MVELDARRLRRGPRHPRREAGEGVGVAHPLHRALGLPRRASSSTPASCSRSCSGSAALPAFNFSAFLALSPFIVVAYLAAAASTASTSPSAPRRRGRSRARPSRRRSSAPCSRSRSPSSAARSRALCRVRRSLIAFVARHASCSSAGACVFLRFGNVRWPEQRVLIVGTGPVSRRARRRARAPREVGLPRRRPHRPDLRRRRARDRRDGRLPGPGPRVRHRPARARAQRQPRHRREPGRAARARRVARARRRVRVRVDVVPELYEIFIGTVDAIVGDIPLMEITRSTVPALVRAPPSASSTSSASLCCSSSRQPRPARWPRSRSCSPTGSPITVLAGAQRQGPQAVLASTSSARWSRTPRSISGPVLAEEDDPRITRVGRFLRKTRIDELPQLFNILKGEMSFVGPRPERPVLRRAVSARRSPATASASTSSRA